MKKVLIVLSLFLMVVSLIKVQAQDLTEDQLFELYKESCDQKQIANCYQLGKWYQRNQRLDPAEEKEIRESLETYRLERKKLKEENPEAELDDADLEEIKNLRLRLTADQQKARSAVLALNYLKEACDNGEDVACKDIGQKKGHQESNLLFYASLGLIGIAVFLITKTIFQDEDQFQAQEKLEDSKQGDDISRHGIILRYSRPFLKDILVPSFQR